MANPEERRASAKFSHAVHLDSSSRKSELADKDDVASGAQDVNTTRGKNGRTHGNREMSASSRAPKAHVEMYSKAIKFMDKMEVMLGKYESPESDQLFFLKTI